MNVQRKKSSLIESVVSNKDSIVSKESAFTGVAQPFETEIQGKKKETSDVAAADETLEYENQKKSEEVSAQLENLQLDEIKKKKRRKSRGKKKKKKSLVQKKTRKLSHNHFVPTSVLASFELPDAATGLKLKSDSQKATLNSLRRNSKNNKSLRKRRNSRRTVMKRPKDFMPTQVMNAKSLDLLAEIEEDLDPVLEEVEEKPQRKKSREVYTVDWKQPKSFDEVLDLVTSGSEAISISNVEGLTNKDLFYLSKVVEDNSQCSMLSFANAKVKDPGALAVSSILQNHPKLVYLHLWGNQISDLGVEYIAAGLSGKGGENLESLILSHNLITEIGADALCCALEKNKKLLFLDLGENKIEDTGALYFAKLLRKYNNSLERLDLSDNGITEFGARALARALRVNTSIHELTLAFNTVTENGDEKMQTIGWLVFSMS
eukprot:augustus_masked-scaffold_5-processed-gene-13.23-mRNA-1 protein AED:0.31 eAED:0.31 QI:0/-1/0/1/-1/1/1/0/432